MKRKVLAIFSLLLIVLLVACSSKSLDGEKVFEIEFVGVNGYGQVQYSRNDDYVKDALHLNDKEYDDYSDDDYSAMIYMDSLDLEYDSSQNYENGDEIEFTVVDSENLADSAKVNLKNETFKCTVEGLEEAEIVNPFDKIDVSFHGDDGQGTVYFENNNVFRFPIDCSFSKEEFLNNGDKITLNINYDEEEARSLGYVLEPLDKEYTVEGLKTYESLDLDSLYELVDIEISGKSPRLAVRFTDSFPKEIKNTAIIYHNSEYRYAMGDEVEYRILFDEESLKAANYTIDDAEYFEYDGYEYLSSPVQTVTVPDENVSFYIDDIAQLSAEDRKIILEEAINFFESREKWDTLYNPQNYDASSLWLARHYLTVAELENVLLYFRKPNLLNDQLMYSDDSVNMNKLIFVFRSDDLIHKYYKEEGYYTGYGYVYINDVHLDENGNFNILKYDFDWNNNMSGDGLIYKWMEGEYNDNYTKTEFSVEDYMQGIEQKADPEPTSEGSEAEETESTEIDEDNGD